MFDNLTNHKDIVMGNTHSQQERLEERSEEFQLATKSSRQRQRSRPSPLVLEDVNSAEQPRISPLPPTPDSGAADEPLIRKLKRKAPSSVIEEQKPTYIQKANIRKVEKRMISKTRPSTTVVARRVKANELDITMNDSGAVKEDDEQPFRFLDLPGEIRNAVYEHCVRMSDKQVLLVYRPKTSTLRNTTRQVRGKPGRYSEIEAPEKTRHSAERPESSEQPELLESNRPFVGLTQICKQIREEFYPLYIGKQEVGLDFAYTAQYTKTFFNPNQKMSYSTAQDPKRKNMPFRGNITVALGYNIMPVEKVVGSIDALPLLNTWANSSQIEAGFGRYSRLHFIPQRDGEAKDLYRLYGRKVLPDRTCSAMNKKWRAVLRHHHLAAIQVYRTGRDYRNLRGFQTPFIHLIWKYEHREPWMDRIECVIPDSPTGTATPNSWLGKLGFDRMEHFTIRVGAEQKPGQILPEDSYEYWGHRII